VDIDQVAGANSRIKAIAHLKKTAGIALVASEDQLLTYDLIKQAVVDVVVSKKKS